MMPLTLVLLRALSPGCWAVEGESLTAADLAPAWPAWAQLAPNSIVGRAPVPGAQRVLERAELASLAARFGLAPATVPERVCFARKAAALDEAALRAALAAAVAPGWQMELNDWSRAPLPPGELLFDRRALPRLPRTPVLRPVLWRGVLVSGSRRYPVWVRVRLWVDRPRLEARERIPSGSVPATAQLVLAEGPEYPLWPLACQTLDAAAGQQTRRTLAAGDAVVPRDLAPAPAVRRGEPVAIEVAAGPARLAVRAVAEAPARIGQIVLVKNPLNGRRFPARVTAPGQAAAVTDLTRETP